MISFGSKAETLQHLENVIKKAKVLPQICLHAFNWDKISLKNMIESRGWKDTPLIVRSSAYREDAAANSFAGRYVSISNIQKLDALHKAIEQVISSYGKISTRDLVFIQPMLESICMSGVAFSCDPRTGAPYRVINYDDVTGLTNSVTSGRTNTLKIHYAHRLNQKPHPEYICQIIDLLDELELYFGQCPLNVEFAISKANELFLLQVRPLHVKTGMSSLKKHVKTLYCIEKKIETLSKSHPYLHGSKSMFGIMTDWNPAEIIGARPRPLALSLYKEIITDHIWANQRSHYGYRDLKGFPLLVHFQGIPYIDIRVSFNSFIPSDLENRLSEKLVNFYLNKLENNPNLHDKVEFEIVHSCNSLDLHDRLKELSEANFSQAEILNLTNSLRTLTNRIIDPVKGLFYKDLEQMKQMENRFEAIQSSSLDIISKIYWLLEDCKRYGSLPFVGIARAAFIAMQILKSLVTIGILSKEEMNTFISSLTSICSRMQHDKVALCKSEFLKRYGHLREGTYDILSSRYDEAPEKFFDWNKNHESLKNHAFALSPAQQERINVALHSMGFNHNAHTLFAFIKSAIEERENSKFLFTKNLSEVLLLISQLGLSLEDCSYLNINAIKELYSCSLDVKSVLHKSIKQGKKMYASAHEIILPPLIINPLDLWSFDLKQADPNYITLKKATGAVHLANSSERNLSGKIVMIPSADPGYDWIFTCSIAGLITMYGGVNSHMAIRSAEAEIPAVIGAGEVLYHRWSQAQILEIDCYNKTVRRLS